jgi:hypothetical protein
VMSESFRETKNVIKRKNRKEKTNNELCVMNYF